MNNVHNMLPAGLTEEHFAKWRQILNTTARACGAAGAVLTRQDNERRIVILTDESLGEVFPPGHVISTDGAERCRAAGDDEVEDVEWGDCPLVDSGFSSCLGVPVRMRNGSVFCSLCLFDEEKRELTEQERGILDMSREVLQNHLARVEDGIERDQREREARESADRFRMLFEVSIEGIVVVEDGIICDVNAAALDMFGYEKDEVVGMPAKSFLAPAYHDTIDHYLSGRHEGVFEAEGIRKDGTRMLCEARSKSFRLHGRLFRVTSFRDVTQERAVIRELEKNEQLLRKIINLVPHNIFARDANGRFILANDSSAAFFGVSAGEMIGKHISELHAHPDDVSGILEADRRIMESGREQHMTEREIINARGEICLHDTRKIPFVIPGTGERAVLGIGIDLGDRIRAEREVRQSGERFRFIFDNAPVAIWEYDVSGAEDYLEELQREPEIDWPSYLRNNPDVFSRFFELIVPLDANRAALRLYGASSREELFVHYGENLNEDAREVYIKAISAYIGGKSAFSCESLNRSLNGRNIDLHYRFTFPPSDTSIRHVLVTVEDISERRRMEEERNKASRLESLGLLSGGIAHDFNNLLAAVLGNISLVRMNAEMGSEDHDILKDAEKAVLSAKDLTRQLLTFSRGGEPVRTTVDIESLVRETSIFALRGSNVTVEFNMDGRIDMVDVDSGQFSQVFNNIVINAKQAMPDGGLITIAGRNLTVGEEDIISLPPGDYVHLSITDTGCGIPRNLLPKIFDPYFTTKDTGTGLGLATVYSIVRRHGGLVTVESEEGGGTMFHLYVPASLSTAAAEETAESSPAAAGGRILVMDDEEPVLNILKKMLKRLGHEVTGAADGAEAIDLYTRASQEGAPYDLVIMDLTVPGGMGGREAASRLREMDGDVTMIISSGYANDEILSRHAEHGFSGYIIKPYTIENLRDAITRVL